MRIGLAALAVGCALAAGCGGEDPTAEPPEVAAGGDAIELLAVRWYAQADPGVCDEMTDPMLLLGWSATGADGRAACRTSIAEDDPVEDVVVGEASVDGDEGSVVVEFTLDGEPVRDIVRFRRVDDRWLIDGVSTA